MGKDLLKDNMGKWFILLAVIVIAFILANKSLDEKIKDVWNKPVFNVKEKVNSAVIQNTPRKPLLSLEANDDTVFLYGQVSEENSETLSQKIIDLNSVRKTLPILLVIDSPGGVVFPGTKVISAIESSKRPLYTVCYGLCASMAAMIHQYGHKRYMTDRSVLMFHNAAGGANGELNKMISQLTFIDRFVGKMEAYIEKRAQLSHDQYVKMIDSELWIDADDSLTRHFSDQTVTINLQKVKKTTILPFMEYRKHKAKEDDDMFINTVVNEIK